MIEDFGSTRSTAVRASDKSLFPGGKKIDNVADRRPDDDDVEILGHLRSQHLSCPKEQPYHELHCEGGADLHLAK